MGKQGPEQDSSNGAKPRTRQTVGIRMEGYLALREIAEEEDRSVNYMADKAVKEFIERHRRARKKPQD